MALFYKGVGVGTYLHTNDPRTIGMPSRASGMANNIDATMRHVARGTTVSPYVSLTRSYGVAEMYALEASRTRLIALSQARPYVAAPPRSPDFGPWFGRWPSRLGAFPSLFFDAVGRA